MNTNWIAEAQEQHAREAAAKASADLAARHIPTEPGLYWARTDKQFTWWNLIVEIGGDAPFLEIKNAWKRSYGRDLPEKPTECYFGPKIDVPEVPREQIVNVIP